MTLFLLLLFTILIVIIIETKNYEYAFKINNHKFG